MSWTAPRTWVVNEIVTASIMNTHVRDNLLSLEHLLDHTTADNDITSTAAEQTLYSVSVPANALGATGWCRIELHGDFLYNRVTSDTIVFRVKFGGTTLWTSVGMAPGNATTATRGGWEMEVKLKNEAAAVQSGVWTFKWGSTSNGNPNGGPASPGVAVFSGTIDTTSARTLEVTVDYEPAGAGTAANSFRRLGARAMLGQN